MFQRGFVVPSWCLVKERLMNRQTDWFPTGTSPGTQTRPRIGKCMCHCHPITSEGATTQKVADASQSNAESKLQVQATCTTHPFTTAAHQSTNHGFHWLDTGQARSPFDYQSTKPVPKRRCCLKTTTLLHSNALKTLLPAPLVEA